MKATVTSVRLSDLINADYNPHSRTKRLTSLVASLEEIGLLYPILITKDREIVDGHRRSAAARKLGWEEIPAIIVAGDQATLYGHINNNSKKLTGNELLCVYLETPAAVVAKVRSRFETAEETLGRRLLARMAKSGLSLATFKLATSIAVSADKHVPTVMKSLVEYMMDFSPGTVQRALAGGLEPNKIIAAATSRRPLKMNFSIGHAAVVK